MISIFKKNPKDIFDPSKPATFVELNYKLKHYIHGLKGAKLAIFLQLACSVDKHGITVMPISRICEDTGYSATEVKETITELLQIVLFDSASDLQARHNGRHILAKISRKEEGKFATNAYAIFPDSSIVKQWLSDIKTVVGVAPKGAIDFFAVKDGMTVDGKLAPYYIDTISTSTTISNRVNDIKGKVQERLTSRPFSKSRFKTPAKEPSAPKQAEAFRKKKPIDLSKCAEVEAVLIKKFGDAGRSLWNEVYAKSKVLEILGNFADWTNTLLYAAAYAITQKQVAPAFVAVLKSAPAGELPRFSTSLDLLEGKEVWRQYFWHKYGQKEISGNSGATGTKAARNDTIEIY